MSCVSCDASPPPCSCPTSQTCVQTPRNCTSCPLNICIDSNSRSLPSGPGSSNNPALSARSGGGGGLGATIGEAVGGVAGGLALIVLGWYLWKKGVLDGLLGGREAGKKGVHRSKRRTSQLQDQLQLSFRPGGKRVPAGALNGKSNLVNHGSAGSHGSPTPQGTSTGIAGSNGAGDKMSKRQSAHLVDVDLDEVDLIDVPKSSRSAGPDGASSCPFNGFAAPLTSESADPFGDHHSLKSFVATPTPSTPAGAIGSSASSRPLSKISERSSLILPPSSSFDRFSGIAGDFDAIIANLAATEAGQQGSSSSSGPATAGQAIPIAYIPPDSKSLSIDDVASRDGFGNPRHLPSSGSKTSLSARRRTSQGPTTLPSLPSLPSDINLPTLPPPTALLSSGGGGTSPSAHLSGGTSGAPLVSPALSATGKPIRPPRPSDLDLKLPTPKKEASAGSEPPTSGTRPPSGFPWTTPGQTTPTPAVAASASGSKGSHFSTSTVNTLQLARASDASTVLGYTSPSTLPSFSTQEHLALSTIDESDIDRRSVLSTASDGAQSSQSHLSSILDPAMIVTPVTLIRTASGRQNAVQRVMVKGQERAKVVKIKGSGSANSLATTPTSPESGGAAQGAGDEEDDPFGDHQSIQQAPKSRQSRLSSIGEEDESRIQRAASRNDEIRPDSRASNTDSVVSDISSTLHGGGFQTAERVNFVTSRSPLSASTIPSPPTTAATSVAPKTPGSAGAVETLKVTASPIVNVRSDGRPGGPLSPLFPSPPTSRVRKGSVSPVRGVDENRRPSLAEQAAAGETEFQGSPTPLPEPFKPFAGQKPTSMTPGSAPLGARSENPHALSVASTSRLSVASSVGGDSVSVAGSVRSGYGSVLEGIPFNIGIGGLGLGSERGSVMSDGDEAALGIGSRMRGVSMISTSAASEGEGSVRFSDVPVMEMPSSTNRGFAQSGL